MRHLAVLLLAASGGFAADFATGQAARLVIGQPTFPEQSTDWSKTSILGGSGAVAFGNGVLVVGDVNRLAAGPINPRVLIYRGINQQLPDPTAEIPKVDGVRCPACLGQPSMILGKREPRKDTTGKEVVDDQNRVIMDWVIGLSPNQFRLPAGVATDGTRLVVSDTDNNRVLIWNNLPTSTEQGADVVVGQPDFVTDCPNSVGPRNQDGVCTGDVRVPSARSLKGPQGVWIQGNRLFVADDQNHRVLIWNNIPTQNFQPADLVLGAPDFTSVLEIDLSKKDLNVKPETLLNPVSVTSDGQRVFVADLGHNRVVIWNSLPTRNGQPADVAVGQPDLVSPTANNVTKLCQPTGQKDANGNDIYPRTCAATLDFPRFALSDGQRLFIADGGNDRVLVFNSIPAQHGARADAVLGQANDTEINTTDNENVEEYWWLRQAASDVVRTPTSLAWDGTNLYVADPFARRVLVFSPAPKFLPLTGVRNAASLDVFAVGAVTLSGQVKENDEVTITIQEKEYKYKIKKDDTFEVVIDGLVAAINAGEGDARLIATPNYALSAVILTSRLGGEEGNTTEYSTAISKDAVIVATAAGTSLAGGKDAAKIGPGSLISIFGEGIADLAEGEVVSAPANADPLPGELAGVQVYIDGMQAPIMSVSRNQVNAQLPYEVFGSSSVTAWVRTRQKNGTVTATTALGVPVVTANPGIFAEAGPDPRPAIALHGSSYAVGTVSVDGAPKKDDKVSVTIRDRKYEYTAVEGDTLDTVQQHLIDLINAGDPEVEAFKAGQFNRIRLRARVQGPEGNGIEYSGSSEGNTTISNTTSALCCANVAGARITEENPAIPGENIIVYATGLGMIERAAELNLATGYTFKSNEMNKALERVDSLAGGKTANVLYMGLKPGTVGIYEVHLELLSDLPTNPRTQLTIAQQNFVSNIVTLPVFNPNPVEE
jgi:hypothetical protein